MNIQFCSEFFPLKMEYVYLYSTFNAESDKIDQKKSKKQLRTFWFVSIRTKLDNNKEPHEPILSFFILENFDSGQK